MYKHAHMRVRSVYIHTYTCLYIYDDNMTYLDRYIAIIMGQNRVVSSYDSTSLGPDLHDWDTATFMG